MKGLFGRADAASRKSLLNGLLSRADAGVDREEREEREERRERTFSAITDAS